ncbi:hypothetical protein NQZ68_028464 [Dissostichus eleginoides]|nr:hypothetical protein NQZ68_028464 [Dissostichus eleginoides]
MSVKAFSCRTAAKRPSSASSLPGIVGRMMSSVERGASSSSCTSVNTLSSSASSVSLQDTSHSSSSSSSSSSLPYGAVPTYNSSSSSTPKRNGSDISLDLTPLVRPHGGGGGGGATAGGGGACGAQMTGEAPPPDGAALLVEVPLVAPPRQLSRLDRVVLEIVETEQAYVRDLKSIVEASCSQVGQETQKGGGGGEKDDVGNNQKARSGEKTRRKEVGFNAGIEGRLGNKKGGRVEKQREGGMHNVKVK